MDMEHIKAEWEAGKTWIDNITRDFPDLDTLADGVSLTKTKGAPQVGTVTLANAVRQIPRESVQQLPVQSVAINGTKLSLDALVASFLLRDVVFNKDTFGNGVLSTMQLGAQIALTQGFVPLRANVGKIFNKFSTMLETLHYNDIVIEPGIFDVSNSSYYHVRTRVTKGALKSLLKSAKANPNTQWNVKELRALYDAGPQPVDYNAFLSTPRKNQSFGGQEQYDIVTRYGVGSYYDIVVYSPQSEKPLMEIKSKSKFGYPRISFLVIDPAQLLPTGVSRARLASPMANYGNIYLQSTAKMQLLNADPPTFKRGLFTSATPLRRGAEWTSVDPNADVRIMELSNSNLEQFSTVMNYIDGNILATMGVGGDMAPSSVYQNTAQVEEKVRGKTLASAQVTTIVENAIRQYALTALDLYLSEQVGTTALIVDDEAKNAINQIMPATQSTDPQTGMPVEVPFVGDDNVVEVDWEAYYDRIQTWTVHVDMSISQDDMGDKKRGDLQNILTVESQTGDPNDPNSQATKAALTKEILEDSAPGVAKEIASQPQQVAPVGGVPMQGQ